ncbi:MAG: thioredoxin [Bacteroidia bacterium]|nr:thioredoxin [Bacteroidia bacterium]
MKNFDFSTDVLDRSQDIPVVVDFWAPWCGPCQFLGPVIEGLAEDAQGRWELVKVNTDENPEVSQRYGIRSIPAVKMFHQGQVVAEFVGALPKHQIMQWLNEHLPDERKEQLERIKEKLHGANHPQALKELEAFVAHHPDMEEGRLWLAFEKVFENPDEAQALVTDVGIGHKLYDLAEAVRNLAQLMNCQTDGNAILEEKINRARQSLKKQDQESALQSLIEAVMIDKTYCDELPRKATIALFYWLGTDHELTQKYRRRFDRALY